VGIILLFYCSSGVYIDILTQCRFTGAVLVETMCISYYNKVFLSCLTDQRPPNIPLALRHTPSLGRCDSR
jgi:hypothetical protein